MQKQRLYLVVKLSSPHKILCAQIDAHAQNYTLFHPFMFALGRGVCVCAVCMLASSMSTALFRVSSSVVPVHIVDSIKLQSECRSNMQMQWTVQRYLHFYMRAYWKQREKKLNRTASIENHKGRMHT